MQPLVTFDAGGVAVHVRYHAVPAAPEWIAAVRAAARDPRSHAGMRILLDRRDVPPPTVAYLLEILGFVREFQREFAKCEFALLVTEIFTDFAPAMVWLQHGSSPAAPRSA